jgi:hypothetical protein
MINTNHHSGFIVYKIYYRDGWATTNPLAVANDTANKT